jgi:hypothetical protein
MQSTTGPLSSAYNLSRANKQNGEMDLYTYADACFGAATAKAHAVLGETIHIPEDGYYEINISFEPGGKIGADYVFAINPFLLNGATRIVVGYYLQDSNGELIIPPSHVIDQSIYLMDYDKDYFKEAIKALIMSVAGHYLNVKAIDPTINDPIPALRLSGYVNYSSVQYLHKGTYKIFGVGEMRSSVISPASLGIGRAYSDFAFYNPPESMGYLKLNEIRIAPTNPTNAVPIPYISQNKEEGKPYEIIHFDASHSKDSDGMITDWYWEFEEGSTTSATTEHVNVYWKKTGIYTVRLKVCDDKGTWSTLEAKSSVYIKGPDVSEIEQELLQTMAQTKYQMQICSSQRRQRYSTCQQTSDIQWI